MKLLAAAVVLFVAIISLHLLTRAGYLPLPAIPPLAIPAVLLAALVLLATRDIRRKRRRFHNRQDLSRDEFYDRFYSASGIDKQRVIFLLELFALHSGFPAGKLRPSDAFNRELRPSCPADEYLSCLAADSALFVDTSETIPIRLDSDSDNTLDDFIRQTAPRLRMDRIPPSSATDY